VHERADIKTCYSRCIFRVGNRFSESFQLECWVSLMSWLIKGVIIKDLWCDIYGVKYSIVNPPFGCSYEPSIAFNSFCFLIVL